MALQEGDVRTALDLKPREYDTRPLYGIPNARDLTVRPCHYSCILRGWLTHGVGMGVNVGGNSTASVLRPRRSQQCTGTLFIVCVIVDDV